MFPSGSQSTVIKVQHGLSIRLNIHPNDILLHGPKKELQRYGKNAITNTCPSNDIIPISEAHLVLLQGKGHSNN